MTKRRLQIGLTETSQVIEIFACDIEKAGFCSTCNRSRVERVDVVYQVFLDGLYMATFDHAFEARAAMPIKTWTPG